MLRYAAKLTRHPVEVNEGDLDTLRRAGFNDAAISDIAVSTALYAFMNRIVDGLGRALPRGMDREAERLGLLPPNSDRIGADG
jgi:alkylhydroperoxidase family enzyme